MVANTHYLPEQLEAHLTPPKGVTLSHEPSILETGGGLRAALPMLGGDGPVFTLNSDAIWTGGANPLRALAKAWDPDRMDGLLMLIPQDNARGHMGKGDFLVAPNGHLSRGPPGAIYSGAQIIRTDLLHEVEGDVFSLNILWDQMIDTGRLHGITHDGAWCDVGRPPEGIATAEAMLADV